jgi:hypothetical protein
MNKFIYFCGFFLFPILIQCNYLNMGFNTPNELSTIKINHDQKVSHSTLVSLENPIIVNGIMIESGSFKLIYRINYKRRSLQHQRQKSFHSLEVSDILKYSWKIIFLYEMCIVFSINYLKK